MTPQAVLFDLDGTLVDSAADLALAVNRMRQQRAQPPLPIAQYRPLVGSGARGLLPIGLDADPDSPSFASLRDEFFDTYEACIGEATQPFDGVAQVLDALRVGQIPWGIVTNKIERLARPIVAGDPALAQCQALVGGDTTAHAKPHPLPLLHAAALLKVPPSGCIYVGDDRRDMLAGKSAGMTTVAARYGYIAADDDTATWPADHYIDSPLELLTLLGIE
ncbi:phosphoglycolate phosphatase [Lampropedia cohaerens]|uniref:Phosphoglycolate phosphatase n=1 Tax=Lampropedia cohaerens TaxID=1610491 RepID=A0A0U1PZJ6_9BURK|nr:HAD-IA family hydrolase [Lampropedia cohaerens]KKW67930.1 phosphoglycolate phosphatase [Lampropedia cohaerens]